MRITHFEWDAGNIAHLGQHGVNPEEAEEACHNRPYVLKGKEGLYLIYSQTDDGRYLLVVARYRGRGIIRTITARNMTEREKRLCQERR